jgi:hypothetical protein
MWHVARMGEMTKCLQVLVGKYEWIMGKARYRRKDTIKWMLKEYGVRDQ